MIDGLSCKLLMSSKFGSIIYHTKVYSGK